MFAEFERAMIVERANAGIKRARRNGTKFGRPRVDGTGGLVKVARELGVGTSTVQRISAEMKRGKARLSSSP
jgi:DNA invertase Pin-like site-specific DNA recombinase